MCTARGSSVTEAPRRGFSLASLADSFIWPIVSLAEDLTVVGISSERNQLLDHFVHLLIGCDEERSHVVVVAEVLSSAWRTGVSESE